MAEDAINRWFENGNGRGRFEKNDLKALWVEIGMNIFFLLINTEDVLLHA